jgi:AcrR family transcriptional regulator
LKKKTAIRKKPKQERSKDTVDVLLQAAVELFSQLGYKGATTNKIAQRAGVSVGSLYQYFPNKKAMLVALFEKQFQSGVKPLGLAIEALGNTHRSLKEVIENLLNVLIQLHEPAPRLHRLLSEEVPKSKKMLEIQQASQNAAVTYVQKMLSKRDDVSIDNITVASHLLVQTSESLSHWFVLHAPSEVQVDVFLNEATKMLYQYVAKSSETGKIK